MKKKPKLSVVMPVFNGEKYLKEAIKSILDQTYKDFELIIIDDGSTDNTLKIISKFQDQRIKLYRNRKNLGLVPSLNTGLFKSSGLYIARCDADDIYDKERFRKQIQFLSINLEYILVSSNAILIDEKGRSINKLIFPEKNENIRNGLQKKNIIIHASVMFRKSIVSQIGGYRHFFNSGAEDYDLWLRLLSQGKFYNFQNFFIKRRIYQSAYSQKFHYRIELMAIIARLINIPNFFKI